MSRKSAKVAKQHAEDRCGKDRDKCVKIQYKVCKECFKEATKMSWSVFAFLLHFLEILSNLFNNSTSLTMDVWIGVYVGL